ncbi:tetratricopeptide repeat protein [Aquimarina litoralis]|uniref:tetratricopeptide repeat protein n=1 Tax=Aquimarina litoralis TaxID=584605 RepID=UPI001C566773|nr:tetratricopeptide repeat protein [Aquimarina litoralis]MBW1297139.1 tetratricopeptide repeat protein [Aquimarina litoralis]
MKINFFNKKAPTIIEFFSLLIIPFIVFIILFSKSKSEVEEKIKNDPVSTISKEEQPKKENELIQLGINYMVNKKYNESITINLQVLTINQNNKIAHNNLCYAYGEIGQYEKGIKHCEKAITIDPNFQLAKNNLNALKAKKNN